MSGGFALDHAVVIVRDRMDAAADTYRRMGFTLTPLGRHQLGSINHLMVFRHDYLELLGFPPGQEQARPEIAASPIGLDGLVFTLDDAEASRMAIADRGFAPNPLQLLTRPVDLGGTMREARFTTLRFPRQPILGGRVYFCGHDTPELVWREEWMTHANGAVAIDTFTVVVPDPAAEADVYARLLDVRAEPWDAETVHVPLARGRIELVTAAAFARRTGSLAPDPRDVAGRPRDAWMAMVTLVTTGIDATRDVLAAGGFHTRDLDDGAVAVPAAEAFNTVIAFVER
jgi:hypothetical protein